MEGSKRNFNDRIESQFNMICMVIVGLDEEWRIGRVLKRIGLSGVIHPWTQDF